MVLNVKVRYLRTRRNEVSAIKINNYIIIKFNKNHNNIILSFCHDNHVG